MRPSNQKYYLRLHFIVFIYGFTGIIGRQISIDAAPLVWHRMWIAIICIWAFLAYKKRLQFNLKQNGLKMILAGIIIAFHWITFFHAIKISTVSVALSCLAAGALFTSFLEPIFYKKKLDKFEIILGVFVIIGLYLIFRFEGDYTLGILIALLSAFLSALFSVINGTLVVNNSPYRITFIEMMSGWLAIGIYMIFSGEFTQSNMILSASDWIYLTILGAICTAYPFIENVRLLKHLSPYTTMLAINLEPIYGIILAMILFNEQNLLSPYFYVGASIILCTVFADALIKKWHKKQQIKEEAT